MLLTDCLLPTADTAHARFAVDQYNVASITSGRRYNVIATVESPMLRSARGRIAAVADNSDAAEFAALTASLRRHLQQRQHAGIRTLPKTEPSKIKPVIVKEAESDSALGGTAADLFADNKAALQADSLEELRAAIGDCQALQALCGAHPYRVRRRQSACQT